jgi:Ras-related protein Rab-2A
MINQYVKRYPFEPKTIGAMLEMTEIERNRRLDELQIWDTAGQTAYRDLVRQYFQSAHGAALVFDLTEPQTCEHVQAWFNLFSPRENLIEATE